LSLVSTPLLCNHLRAFLSQQPYFLCTFFWCSTQKSCHNSPTQIARPPISPMYKMRPLTYARNAQGLFLHHDMDWGTVRSIEVQHKHDECIRSSHAILSTGNDKGYSQGDRDRHQSLESKAVIAVVVIIHSFIHSFIHSIIHSFIHSFIHSLHSLVTGGHTDQKPVHYLIKLRATYSTSIIGSTKKTHRLERILQPGAPGLPRLDFCLQMCHPSADACQLSFQSAHLKMSPVRTL
jgi:hypothetical protein